MSCRHDHIGSRSLISTICRTLSRPLKSVVEIVVDNKSKCILNLGKIADIETKKKKRRSFCCSLKNLPRSLSSSTDARWNSDVPPVLLRGTRSTNAIPYNTAGNSDLKQEDGSSAVTLMPAIQ